MGITDKYYDGVNEEALDAAQAQIEDAIKYASEKHYLSERDIFTLSRILAYERGNDGEGGMFAHVVDFLWMAYRIGFNQKMLLLDLLNE